jgi:hypothetical protein
MLEPHKLGIKQIIADPVIEKGVAPATEGQVRKDKYGQEERQGAEKKDESFPPFMEANAGHI